MKKLTKISMLAAFLLSTPFHAVTVSQALDALETQPSRGSAQNARSDGGTLTLAECHGWGDTERVKAFFDQKPDIKKVVFDHSSLDEVAVFDALGAGRFEAVDFQKVFFLEDALAPPSGYFFFHLLARG